MLEVWLDSVERYVLEPGHVLYVESPRPGWWTNVGDTQTFFPGVNTRPTL